MDEQGEQRRPVIIKKQLKIEQRTITHHISTTEWALVIGALVVVDVAQIVLDLFAIGAAINRFIDILVGGFLALYVKLRCRNIQFGKSMVRMILTFIGEEIPLVDALPLWTLDGFYNMILERAGEKTKQIEASMPVISKTIDMKKGRNGEWSPS